ncbi:MAG: stringent starvation protein B [Lysobacteraceae bacterium]|nr:MAG: stringent starvation protein B [Xanthomonadaceae bacterium]
MTPSQPYLLRALNEWIVDNGLTPHLVVDSNAPGVVVPPGSVVDGRVTLNISPSAVRDLVMTNDEVSFHARFGGRPMSVSLPTTAVIGIYARENGQGMLFPDQEDNETANQDDDDPTPPKPQGPGLRLVK